ncbi:methyltransferase family protein [Aquirufa sp. ROCK-SH2]
MEITLLGIAWVIYFFIHSFLASNKIKAIIQTKIPAYFRYYRLLYNLIALAGLIPLLIQSIVSPDAFLFSSTNIQLIGIVLMLIGCLFLYLAFKTFDTSEFLGFKAESKAQLVQTGMYQYVRHPLYFATIILILGLFLILPTQKMLLVLVISYVYILVGYRLEEQKLILLFGPEYINYQKRVKALLPFLY